MRLRAKYVIFCIVLKDKTGPHDHNLWSVRQIDATRTCVLEIDSSADLKWLACISHLQR